MAKLLARPVGQPSCLPPNVADLAMHLYRKSSVSLAGMPSGPGQGALGRPFQCGSILLRLYPVMAWKRCTKRDIGALRANRIVYRRSGGRNE